jgi:urease accessory protein
VWAFLVTYGGGLCAGDVVPLSVTVQPGATAVLTTQSATKVFHARHAAAASAASAIAPHAPHRLRRPPAVMSTTAVVAPDGLLAVLPDPLVCFADAACCQSIHVCLAPGASCALLDWYCSGRRARGETWAFSSLEVRTHITRWEPGAVGQGGGMATTLAMEATALRASAVAPLSTRMGPAHVVGTLILYGPRCVVVR